MDAAKLQVKIFATPTAGALPPVEAFIPIFHSWIKNRTLPDLMIDVANYAHVPKGPGVVLIGDAYDIFMDQGEGRLGLLHSRKRAATHTGQRLVDAFRQTLAAASLVEKEPALAGQLAFSPQEFLFRINDRLLAPNSEATFAAVRPELADLAARLFEGPHQLSRVGDAKDLFAVRLTSSVPSTMASQLARLTAS